MKNTISKVFQSIGNGLCAEHAGEMLTTYRKLDFLQTHGQQTKTTNAPVRAQKRNDPVALYIVPSLVEHR